MKKHDSPFRPSLLLLAAALALAAVAVAGEHKGGHGRGHDRGHKPQASHADRGHAAPAARRQDYHDRFPGRTEVTTRYHLRQNATYVPLREPFERMGGHVEWRDHDRSAVIVYHDRQVICHPGSREVIIIEGGRRHTEYWEEAPVFYGNEVFVPLRRVSAGLGLAVNFSAGAAAVGSGFFFVLW